jgi:hypothetical protein
MRSETGNAAAEAIAHARHTVVELTADLVRSPDGVIAPVEQVRNACEALKMEAAKGSHWLQFLPLDARPMGSDTRVRAHHIARRFAVAVLFAGSPPPVSEATSMVMVVVQHTANVTTTASSRSLGSSEHLKGSLQVCPAPAHAHVSLSRDATWAQHTWAGQN